MRITILGGGGFLGIGGADDVEVRDDAETADSFHRLVGGAACTDADAVVREDVSHRQFRQRLAGVHVEGIDPGEVLEEVVRPLLRMRD